VQSKQMKGLRSKEVHFGTYFILCLETQGNIQSHGVQLIKSLLYKTQEATFTPSPRPPKHRWDLTSQWAGGTEGQGPNLESREHRPGRAAIN
jgi:hypothetical protein